jgi:predicted RNA-binding protein with PIN domain
MASLLLLIDGYNVLSPVAPPTRSDPLWLHRERLQLISRLSTHLSPETCQRTCVVFDAANPPPDRPSCFEIDGIDIRFAVDHPEADDLIEQIIGDHSVPKQLTVISSDHRVQTAARRRGATPYDSQEWLDDLLDGKVRLTDQASRAGQGSNGGPPNHPDHDEPKPKVNQDEVDDWMDQFGF